MLYNCVVYFMLVRKFISHCDPLPKTLLDLLAKVTGDSPVIMWPVHHFLIIYNVINYSLIFSKGVINGGDWRDLNSIDTWFSIQKYQILYACRICRHFCVALYLPLLGPDRGSWHHMVWNVHIQTWKRHQN